jgi:hypothetical protein
VTAAGERVGQGGLGLAAGGVATQSLESAPAAGAAGQLESGVPADASARTPAGCLGVALNAVALQVAAAIHRCWLSVDWRGEQVQQGLLGDADAAADADGAHAGRSKRLGGFPSCSGSCHASASWRPARWQVCLTRATKR